MHYRLSFQRATQQIIDISISCQIPTGGKSFTLPYWRPGRYTRQDFVKNLADFRVVTEQGQKLSWEKTDLRTWRVLSDKDANVTISYSYYAAQHDAGGTWFDDQLVYVNGITCLLFSPEEEANACTLALDLPEGYTVGGGLPAQTGSIPFESFHQLVDTPFLASNTVEHYQIHVKGIDTHIWIQGNHSLNVSQLLQQIQQYATTQIDLFGDCPVSEYHYLYLFWPFPYRHGVEHYNSTVISMGPGMSMHKEAPHKSLLEISSHEYFHTWNVKALRPADMVPYNYQQENYSTLHYVTEGVTTYYGDLMLWKSGIWSWDQWGNSINGELARHYGMAGKDHTSLTMASYDSWVNGYDTSGFPNRRISFYTKGYLVAMITDHLIRQYSHGAYNLDDVLHEMYQTIAKAGKGYTAEDYLTTVEKYAGRDMKEFAAKYIHGIQPLELMLEDIAAVTGQKLIHVAPSSPALAKLGIVWSASAKGEIVVDNIWPDSPADSAALYPGDHLLAINGLQIGKSPDNLLERVLPGEPVELTTWHQGQIRTLSLKANLTTVAAIPQFISMIDATQEQQAYRETWKRLGGAASVPSSAATEAGS